MKKLKKSLHKNTALNRKKQIKVHKKQDNNERDIKIIVA